MRVIAIFLALAIGNILFFGFSIIKVGILAIFFLGLLCAVVTKD